MLRETEPASGAETKSLSGSETGAARTWPVPAFVAAMVGADGCGLCHALIVIRCGQWGSRCHTPKVTALYETYLSRLGWARRPSPSKLSQDTEGVSHSRASLISCVDV
jgi:hypothetical protein